MAGIFRSDAPSANKQAENWMRKKKKEEPLGRWERREQDEKRKEEVWWAWTCWARPSVGRDY